MFYITHSSAAPQVRQRSPPNPRSRRSRSRSLSPRIDKDVVVRAEVESVASTKHTTYIPPWMQQSRGRQMASKSTLPDVVPPQPVPSPPRKRG